MTGILQLVLTTGGPADSPTPPVIVLIHFREIFLALKNIAGAGT